MISEESLKERINQLASERDKLIANINAYEGAIQDCNYWIDELKKEKENAETSIDD